MNEQRMCAGPRRRMIENLGPAPLPVGTRDTETTIGYSITGFQAMVAQLAQLKRAIAIVLGELDVRHTTRDKHYDWEVTLRNLILLLRLTQKKFELQLAKAQRVNADLLDTLEEAEGLVASLTATRCKAGGNRKSACIFGHHSFTNSTKPMHVS